MRTKMQIAAIVGKNILGLAIVGAVVVGIVAASFSIHSWAKTRAITQQATQQTAQAQIAADGTTHDMTIVWPSGTEQTLCYSETITPKSSTYTGPKNHHRMVIDMFSFNPLDSANKAGERVTPSTFAEGERPSIDIDENGVKTSKSKGAEAIGQGGSEPVMGEYLGWAGIVLLGVVGLFIILGVGKWLWAEWQKVEPAVAAAVGAAVPALAPVMAAVSVATPPPPAAPPAP